MSRRRLVPRLQLATASERASKETTRRTPLFNKHQHRPSSPVKRHDHRLATFRSTFKFQQLQQFSHQCHPNRCPKQQQHHHDHRHCNRLCHHRLFASSKVTRPLTCNWDMCHACPWAASFTCASCTCRRQQTRRQSATFSSWSR